LECGGWWECGKCEANVKVAANLITVSKVAWVLRVA
jgi:hypothetical protein